MKKSKKSTYKRLRLILQEVQRKLREEEISVEDAEKILIEVYGDFQEKESQEIADESKELISILFPNIITN